jgi:NAD(P)H-hydrate repair Nnr-like enzyme with NAD(P)H-hydrate dehydratase domain
MGSILAVRPENPFYAACFAAYACGKAGEYAQEECGATFMQPGDTIGHLSRVFREFE